MILEQALLNELERTTAALDDLLRVVDKRSLNFVGVDAYQAAEKARAQAICTVPTLSIAVDRAKPVEDPPQLERLAKREREKAAA
jgi:hypothetical protein